MTKRLIDIILSVIGLIIMAPVFLVIALLIKLDSKGLVFYPVERVGKDMKPFRMYKFRTMLEQAANFGDSVSPALDPRVTTFGRFLRSTKLNEFPQLINILKGEMTFVGPRPESPDLAELYPKDARKVFSVTPGLVGPNQVLNRNEEELYPEGVDPKRFYIEHIMPPKLKNDLEYIKNRRLFKDIIYIFLGVKETLHGVFCRKNIRYNRSQVYLFFCDIILILFSYMTVSLIISRQTISMVGAIYLYHFLITLLTIRLCCLAFFSIYRTIIRHISYYDVLLAIKGAVTGGVIIAFLSSIIYENYYTPLIALADTCLVIFLFSASRFSLRFIWELKNRNTSRVEKKRVIIYGAGFRGRKAFNALIKGTPRFFDVVGFVDDSPSDFGKILNGRKVLGNGYHLSSLAKLYKVSEVILALETDQPDKISKAIEVCQCADLSYRIFVSVDDNGDRQSSGFLFRGVDLSDILSLKTEHMDHQAVKMIFNRKTVLINGSGGELGLGLCRQILLSGCKKIVILDRYESYLTHLVANLYGSFSKEAVVPIIISNGKDDIERIFQDHHPDIVINMTARKFTQIFQYNNSINLLSDPRPVMHLAYLSKKYNASYFVMISSLLANEKNHEDILAESLRNMENLLQEIFNEGQCRLLIVRTCDILENKGGIVSIIEDQIKRKGTVTLTSPDAKVYLISKDSAARFILHSLVEASKNGIKPMLCQCDNIQPLSVVKIAEKLAALYGMKLGRDLPVRYIN